MLGAGEIASISEGGMGGPVMWHRPVWSDAGLNDPCHCIHRSRDSQCFSVDQTTLQHCPLPWGSRSPSTAWFLAPTWVSLLPRKAYLDRFMIRSSEHMWPNTDHTTCDICTVATGRIYAMHAMRPKMVVV